MEDNNINNMDELKQQFSVLTNKLKSQQINNDELLHTVMKNKMRCIDKFVYVETFLLLPFCIFMFWVLYNTDRISLTFFAVTVVLVVLEVISDAVINKTLGKEWLEKDLLSFRQVLLNMKKKRMNKMVIAFPVLMVWASFFTLEFIGSDFSDKVAVVIAVVCIIGGTIAGFMIDYRIFKKMQRINDEIIKEIDGLKE